jgi:hypothetical protein
MMIRIYADFNTRDEKDRVALNTVGSLHDLETHKCELIDGLPIILYMPDVEVSGNLVFDEGIWWGIPDWNTVHHLDSPNEAPN